MQRAKPPGGPTKPSHGVRVRLHTRANIDWKRDVEQFAQLLGFVLGPLEIRGVEFHTLVAHFGDSTHRSLRVALQLFADGVKLQPNRDGGSRASPPCERQRCGEGEKSSARDGV